MRFLNILILLSEISRAQDISEFPVELPDISLKGVGRCHGKHFRNGVEKLIGVLGSGVYFWRNEIINQVWS